MKALRWLDQNLEKTVCVALFMLFTAIIVINVFMRFVLHSAIPWASDLVLYIFVWFIWFAISYGFKTNAHVNVTVVVDMLPRKVQSILKLLCNIIILCGFAVLFVVGIQLLSHSSVVGKTGLLIKYPMWSLYLSSPIGLTLSMIRVVQIFIKEIKELGNNKMTGLEAREGDAE